MSKIRGFELVKEEASRSMEEAVLKAMKERWKS